MTSSQQLPSAPSMSAAGEMLERPGRVWLLLSVQLLLIAAGFVLLWPTTHSLLLEWEDTSKTTYTHGYLIVAISLWLLWRNRRELSVQSVAPSLMAAWVLAGLSLMWLVCLRAGIRTGAQVMLPAMMWAAVCSALGWRVAMLTAFAFGYLYFAIPLWGAINDLLQQGTVVAVDLLLRITGVTAWVNGNMVHLAAGTFEIAGGCSGLHFFIVALALAALYGEVHHDYWRTRLKVLAIAALLAVLTNWLRVYIIILAGYMTDMQHYLVRVEHYRFGWAVFAVMMTVFFYIVRHLPVTERAASPVMSSSGSTRDVLRGTVLAVAAFALGPLWNAVAPISAAPLLSANALLPNNPGGWSGPRFANEGQWHPVFSGADVQRVGTYHSSGRMVTVFVAVYAWQEQGKELVGYGGSLLEQDSSILGRNAVAGNGHMEELIVAHADGKQSVLRYTYRIGSLQTASGLVAQVGYGLASLLGPRASSVLALRTPCEPDCAAARTALDDFMHTEWPVAQ